MNDAVLLCVFFCMPMAFMTLLPRNQPSDYLDQLTISLAAFFGAFAVLRKWLQIYIPVAFIFVMIMVNIQLLLLVTP